MSMCQDACRLIMHTVCRALKDAKKAEADALEQLAQAQQKHGSAASQLAEAVSRSEAAEEASERFAGELRDYKVGLQGWTSCSQHRAASTTMHRASCMGILMNTACRPVHVGSPGSLSVRLTCVLWTVRPL